MGFVGARADSLGDYIAMPVTDAVVGRYLRWFLALLSGACGLVHFAVSREHFDVTWMHGSFFSLLGWTQLAWAVAIVVTPRRRVLAFGAAVNSLALAVWAVSRVWGMPVGPDAGVAEAVGFADAMVAGFEGVIVAASLGVLLRPKLWEQRVEPALARIGLAAGGLAVVVVSTAAMTPSMASDHAHGAGGHGADGHGATVIQADGTSRCEQAGVTNAANSANGGHGHRGPVPWEPLDTAGRTALAEQLADAQAVIERYPTVRDAEAGGYRKASVYVPCIASHYVSDVRGGGEGFDPAHPLMLLFAGTDPDSEIVGLSYTTISPSGPPDGFAGPNDIWHAHETLCMGRGLVLGTEEADSDGCEARGGSVIDTSDEWMIHVWIVPQWENRWGIFASEHPDLGGRMGDMDAPPDSDAEDTWFEVSPP